MKAEVEIEIETIGEGRNEGGGKGGMDMEVETIGGGRNEGGGKGGMDMEVEMGLEKLDEKIKVDVEDKV